MEKLTDTYRKEETLSGKGQKNVFQIRKRLLNFIKDNEVYYFPGYFSVDSSASVFPEHYVAYRLNDLYDCLQEQIEIAFYIRVKKNRRPKNMQSRSQSDFLQMFPEIQRMLLTDCRSGLTVDRARVRGDHFLLSWILCNLCIQTCTCSVSRKMCRLFQELCLNMHMVIQVSISIRVLRLENISSFEPWNRCCNR